MLDSADIKCPVCNSTEILIFKRGSSSIAMWSRQSRPLTKLLGLKTLTLICVQCGARFHPAEAISARESLDADLRSKAPSLDDIDLAILNIYREKGKTAAITYCKNARFLTLATAKKKVETLAHSQGLAVKKEGCFIATACYGDYEAREVRILRLYRDVVLLNSTCGRQFIFLYYLFSPLLATIIGRCPPLKRLIRLFLLDPIVFYLEIKVDSE